MPTVRPETSVTVNPSSNARANADAIAALPDKHSTPMPSSEPMMFERRQWRGMFKVAGISEAANGMFSGLNLAAKF
jgi:hypothetical protein